MTAQRLLSAGQRPGIEVPAKPVRLMEGLIREHGKSQPRRGAVQTAVAADVVLAYARNHAAERQNRGWLELGSDWSEA